MYILEYSNLLEFNIKLPPKHDGAHGLRINVLFLSTTPECRAYLV